MDIKAAIKELAEDGLTVHIKHIRACSDGTLQPKWLAQERGVPVMGKGGATICRVFSSDGHAIVAATALCNPQDNFNKHLGATKALGRAIGKLQRMGRL